MSVHKKLQGMLSSDETGTFLTEEKRKELKVLNEAFFSKLGNLGGDLTNLAKSVTSSMMKVSSAAGKGILAGLQKLDVENFKKKFDVKEIQDLDDKLSLMKVNNPELFSIMKTLMTTLVKVKKVNPELYKKANEIFEKHLTRMAHYYDTLLDNTKDPDQAMMYLAIMTDMIKWADKDSSVRQYITQNIANFQDQQAYKDAGINTKQVGKNIKVLKKIGKEPPPVQELQKATRGRTYANMTRDDLVKLDAKQLQDAITVMTNYLAAFEEVDAGTTIKTGRKMIDMEMMGVYDNVKNNLAYAKNIINKAKPAATKPEPPTKPAPVAP